MLSKLDCPFEVKAADEAGNTAAPLRVSLPSRLTVVVVPGCSGAANTSLTAAIWLACTFTLTVAVSHAVAFGAGRQTW